MEVNKILMECIRELRDLEIPINENVSHTVRVKRMTSLWGSYDYDREQISLSDMTIDLGEDAVRDVLLHELIHCAGVHNHGKTFVYYMNLLNKRGHHLTKSLKTKQACELYNVDYRTLVRENESIVKCPKCGEFWIRSKNSPLVKMCSKYKCFCGTNLEVEE